MEDGRPFDIFQRLLKRPSLFWCISRFEADGIAIACELKCVSFRNGVIDVAGVVCLPDGFGSDGKHPALVIVQPGSSVKEQTAAIYGEKMAEKGYVTLTFDPSYQQAVERLESFYKEYLSQ